MDNKTPQPNPLKPAGKGPKFNISWIYGAIILILLGSYFFSDTPTTKDVPFSTFQEYVKNGDIESIDVYSSKGNLEAKVKSTSVKKVFGQKSEQYAKDRTILVRIPQGEEFSKFMQKAKDEYGFTGIVDYKVTKDYFEIFIYSVFPFLLLIGLIVFMNRRMMGQMGGGGSGGIFNVGKSKAQLFDKGSAENKVTFKDVAGLAGAKQEIEEIVAFLKNPSKYTELGGKIPKGALLVGPPGTGKTLLAKAVAGEADVPFFSMSGSDFVEMFVGVGASRVRDLFRQAKEKAPCIIFIDEIDAVGRARGKNPNMGSNDERENTLNQLLTEMDGFGSNSGVIILAATNRADILDKALLRAGRFDRQIHVDLPDVHERKEIFNVHLRPIKINETVDVNFLAKQTPGFSGADIANVCNEAALIAARKNKSYVEKQDFLDAVDRIVGGLEKKTKITTQSEKKSIAFHEAGHATISWMLEHAHPLVKVTIVPRGEALGAAWYLPEERQLTTYEQLVDEMTALLGGRAAEEVAFGHVSTGALNDLERVTKQAYAMVVYYGLDKKIGNISYYDSTGQQEYSLSKPYSEKTAEDIDGQIHSLVESCYAHAKQILTEHKAQLTELATLLLDREVIFTEDVERILGKRSFQAEIDAENAAVEKASDSATKTADSETAVNPTPDTDKTGEPTTK